MSSSAAGTLANEQTKEGPAVAWIESLRARAEAVGLRASARPAPDAGWYQIRNVSEDETELLLYEEIGGWFGASADELVDELTGITASRITVRINSPGGSVFEGIAIANALRAHPATVTTRVDGLAASIASVIAMAGDRLVMMPSTQMMIHDASGICLGNASDMRELADLLDLQSDNIADVYAGRTGGTREEWREHMRAETWYLAEEAVAAGLADEVVSIPRRQPEKEDEEPEPAPPAAGLRRWDLAAYRYAGRAQAPAPPLPNEDEAEPDDGPSAPPGDDLDPVTEPDTTTVPGSSHDQPEPAEPDEGNGWAALAARLFTPASPDDEFNRLKEALL